MSVALPAHRVGTAVVEVRGEGVPLAHADVRVAQTRHAFGFGNIAFELVDAEGRPDPALAQLFLDVFDLAILPFYWADFETEEGRPHTSRMLRTAEWLAAQGVRLKGHPLVWHTLAPPWLLGRSTAEVLDAVRGRIRRDVAAFAGLVDIWDVVNEVVIAPVFANGDNAITPVIAELGGVEFVRRAFAEARAAHPGVALHVNDFDLSSRYEELIARLLDAGVRIDGIGLQTHMHQGYRGKDEVLEVADRFARFGIPLHFTETTLLSGDLMPAHIVDLNDYHRADWPSSRTARPGRPTSWSATTAACSGIRPSPRSPTGASPIAGRGSGHPPGWYAPTARRSRGTTCCATSSVASGGCRRRPCAPMPMDGSRSPARRASTG